MVKLLPKLANYGCATLRDQQIVQKSMAAPRYAIGGRSLVADGAPSRKNFEDCRATGTIAEEVS
ncbi:MAG: hypothetical protein EBE86_022815 [Hormoscilla sp. GUM202]|nr:hypothetical protein [Hormoscilla sp. GM7CHS1pb]MBO1350027.1 hypothetical protein [Hormoscilla sp. GUM202]